jgi:hypothetical protein
VASPPGQVAKKSYINQCTPIWLKLLCTLQSNPQLPLKPPPQKPDRNRETKKNAPTPELRRAVVELPGTSETIWNRPGTCTARNTAPQTTEKFSMNSNDMYLLKYYADWHVDMKTWEDRHVE